MRYGTGIHSLLVAGLLAMRRMSEAEQALAKADAEKPHQHAARETRPAPSYLANGVSRQHRRQLERERGKLK